MLYLIVSIKKNQYAESHGPNAQMLLISIIMVLVASQPVNPDITLQTIRELSYKTPLLNQDNQTTDREITPVWISEENLLQIVCDRES